MDYRRSDKPGGGKMEENKKIIRNVINGILAVVAFIGVVAIILISLFTAYGQEIFAIFVSAMVLLFLIVNRNKGQHLLKFILMALICIVVAGYGVIMFRETDRNYAVVSENSIIIREYHPFEEDTKAVILDGEKEIFFTFNEASSIRMDGATALYPVYASFARNLFEASDEYYTWGNDEYISLSCNGTGNAFKNLIGGKVDIIFCAQPSDKQLEAAEKAGVEFHMHPIGKEAFVFFVNSRNPVEGLKAEEIQQIYSGEIRNWKELGGKNREIIPYQREEGSGSQTAMLSFMRNKQMIEPDTEEVISGMLDVIERVAEYKNDLGAIGYTFRFYSNEMVGNKKIKILKLNGITPDKETIKNGTYPITDCFYAITASKIGEPAPEETNPVLGKFIEWIKGEEGQRIVDEVGYVPMY